MTSTQKAGLHYAWVILAAACVLSIVSRADSASFAVFVDPLVERFDWKRGDISLAYSLAFLCSMPAMLAFGWLGDRYGARALMIGASLMISAGTVLLGMIQDLWHLYVLYGVFVGAFGNAAFMVLLPVIVTRWFEKKMGSRSASTGPRSAPGRPSSRRSSAGSSRPVAGNRRSWCSVSASAWFSSSSPR